MRAATITDARVARDRTASQRLSRPVRTSADRLVAWFGAVQSQDYPLATWSVAQRLAGTGDRIGRAIADGSVLRTHILRPTWHFVAREDLRWMQALTSSRVLAMMQHANRANGIDAARIARATKAIAAALERRGHLTRSDLADVLSRAALASTPWQVGQLLMHAELDAVICSGTPAGGRQTYALVDERAPRGSSMTRDEALATLARRYFQSHGPATMRDFRWWSSLTLADATRAVDILGRAVDRLNASGRTFFAIGTASRAPWTRRAHLLQPFDEFVVAYSESRDVVDVSGVARAGAPTAGFALLSRGVVFDGQLVARWRMAPGQRFSAVVLQQLRRLSALERDAIADAAARFEAFYAASRAAG
jgi:hypothetical protein